MAQEIISSHLDEERLISASTGTSLSTSRAYIQFPALSKAGETKYGLLTFTPRNFVTAVVAQVILNPWLVILKTTNDLAGMPTDYSIEAQDNSTDTSVDLSSLNTVANGDWVLVGSHLPFGGFYVDVDGTNSTGSRTATFSYWNGSSWANTSATDGTSSSTHLDQDGVVTWTVPTLWPASKLEDIYPTTIFASRKDYYTEVPLHWIRWEVNGALDSSVTLDAVLALNRSSSEPEYIAGQTKEQRVKWGFKGSGNIVALTNAGTGRLVANLAVEGKF